VLLPVAGTFRIVPIMNALPFGEKAKEDGSSSLMLRLI
jgi:hypothetical protein